MNAGSRIVALLAIAAALAVPLGDAARAADVGPVAAPQDGEAPAVLAEVRRAEPPPKARRQGACANRKDGGLLAAAEGKADVKACAVRCLASADKSACVASCVQGKMPMSSRCATCVGDIVACSIGECMLECTLDELSPTCTQCRDTEGCTQAFHACAGVSM